MIEIKNLQKSYVKGRVIIPDLNLTFGDTGLNIIVGKSGCGKTTLLNILGAMDLDYEGTVTVDGLDLSQQSYGTITDYRNFTSAFVFQKNSLFEFLTVEENMKLCLNIQNNKADIHEALERVGLKGFEHKKVKSLSGGEKQRVAIARALIKNCKIIFADEPTSALDSKNAHKIFQLFKDISKDKLVIIVTHDVKKAELYADRMIRFVDGEVVEDHVYQEVTTKAKELPQRKTKKFALLPIFFHQLKRGLVINLFIVLLLTLAMTVMNLAREQQLVKDEYDYYGTFNEVEFPLNRAIDTQILNHVDEFYLVKSNGAASPYDYIQYVYPYEKEITQDDAFFLQEFLKEYPLSHVQKGIQENHLIIPGISQTPLIRVRAGGDLRSWHRILPTEYSYYIYDESYNYNLSYGHLPETENEILVTDVVAYEYLANTVQGEFNLQDLVGQFFEIDEIYDTIDSSKISKRFSYESGEDGLYYRYQVHQYIISGIIDTGLLNYYTYDINSGNYLILSDFKNQDEGRNEEFMRSVMFQPYGYIVTQEPLESYQENDHFYGNLSFNQIQITSQDSRDEENVSLNNLSIATFGSQYDFTERNLAGNQDNLNIDVNNRIQFKSTTSSTLQKNQIMISSDIFTKMFPMKYESYQKNIRELYQDVSGEVISLQFHFGQSVYTKEFVIAGVTNSSKDVQIYISDEAYKELLGFCREASQEWKIDLSGYNRKERKELMEKLYQVGYSLTPIDIMPGAYLEFVEGKGETLAEVDYLGLVSLYPNSEVNKEDKCYYVNGINYGEVDNVDNPTCVYMKSSLLKRIALDESYYTTIGNISPYYLFSLYYSTPSTNTGNYALEIASSMYLFLMIVACLISIGFIYLKERREKDVVVRLSMLGVRPIHMYLIHFIIYFVMTLFIGGLTILLTKFMINFINNMFTYSFVHGEYTAIVYRIRLLYTNISTQTTWMIVAIIFVVSMLSAVLITKRYRK